MLRNDLKLKGARYGCGIGACGACMVIVDGKAVQSCDVPVSAVAGKAITTIEGIGTADEPASAAARVRRASRRRSAATA